MQKEIKLQQSLFDGEIDIEQFKKDKISEYSKQYYRDNLEYYKNYYIAHRELIQNKLKKEEEYAVYIFYCEFGIAYVGSTKNLRLRINNHRKGNTFKFLKCEEDWRDKLHLKEVKYIVCKSKEEALALEKDLISYFKPILNNMSNDYSKKSNIIYIFNLRNLNTYDKFYLEDS